MERKTVKLAYANDGTSVYDLFFLKHLTKKNTVYFLTFNNNPQFASSKAIVKKMSWSVSAENKKEGLYMYVLSMFRALMLRLCLRRIKPDIILGCVATKYGFYSALSGFRPFILIIWGSDVLIAPNRFFLFRFMVKLSLRKADAVIVDSNVQTAAVIRLGCDPAKIVEFPWFNPKSVRVRHSRAEVRKQLDWRDNPVVVCLRSHEPIYGVEYLIEAMPQIIKEVPSCRFLIIGAGSLSRKFMERVKELGLEQFVKFFGRVPHDSVASYLNAADVYVSASLSDGTSASLLEAIVSELPPVVTNIPGNTEWIKDSWSGFLVPVRDSRCLAEKIVLLLKDKDLRRRIGKNAFETLNTKVNWHKNLKAVDNLISRLIDRYGHEGRENETSASITDSVRRLT